MASFRTAGGLTSYADASPQPGRLHPLDRPGTRQPQLPVLLGELTILLGQPRGALLGRQQPFRQSKPPPRRLFAMNVSHRGNVPARLPVRLPPSPPIHRLSRHRSHAATPAVSIRRVPSPPVRPTIRAGRGESPRRCRPARPTATCPDPQTPGRSAATASSRAAGAACAPTHGDSGPLSSRAF